MSSIVRPARASTFAVAGRPARDDPARRCTETEEDAMTAYAVAHLRSVDFNASIAEYMTRIDATLEPYGGAFVVHRATPDVLEDEFPGTSW
jgi:hypothetical protein